MQRQLTNDWIDRQLELCEKATEGPWGACRDIQTFYVKGQTGYMVAKFVVLCNAKFIAAAREGYPLVLERLQDTQGELRLVFSILEGLLLGMDDLPCENIKNCIASLVCAGSDWLGKENKNE